MKLVKPSNPYLELAKHLKWDDGDFDWITLNYINYLESKLHYYISFNGSNAEELKKLISCFEGNELKSFLCFPFVADLLHPRTNFHNDENIWPLNVYALSYLSWIGKIPKHNALKEKPDGLREVKNSIPIINRESVFPVSYFTNIDFEGMDRSGHALYTFTPGQISEIASTLTVCTNFIKKWCNNTWKFVSIGTELLIIRGESSEPNRFGSSSFRGLAGLNMLVNPHNADKHLIIDAIVHESIHSLLYQLEPPFEGFFIIKENSRKEVKSPWTGNIITLDNIAQACFVWYGLFNFWLRAVPFESEDEPAREAKYTLAKIIKGFQSLDLSQLEHNLNDNMFEAIKFMQMEINQHTPVFA